MPANMLRARELFLYAVGRLPPDRWEDYVAEACGGDTELERQVGDMLRMHREAGSFLERPAVDWATVIAPPPSGWAADGPAGGDAPGAVIGPYKLLQPLGEGGMGTVFMAEQTHPVHRTVALKLIKAGMDSSAVVARFEAERQALALMDHPNIARVLDAGTTDGGRPYFVMELVQGTPITRFCDDRHLTCEERLLLFVQVCAAVQHAHQKGVIHRDLKPSNVLVALYDGKPVPKVIDFGVAKATGPKLTDRTLYTEAGAVIGTLQYMSPEQAELNNLDVDTRSDVYSLGVLLYELLTGTTPLERTRLKEVTFLEVLRLIREEEPPRPSTRLSQVRNADCGMRNEAPSPGRSVRIPQPGLRIPHLQELDWIALRALEKDRGRRYETAGALAADVQRYLDDEPVQACPPSAWYRFGKFARRNKPALVAASAGVLIVLAAVAGLATSNFLIAREQRETAKALDDLKRATDRERVDAYFHRIALASAALSTNNLGAAVRYLDECPEELRGWEWRYLMRLCKVEPLVIREKSGVHSVAFSRDGERLAAACGDGFVRVWNSRTGKPVAVVENAHGGFACSVAFHPAGAHVASVGADRLVKVWDISAGTPREVFTQRCDAVHTFGTAYAVAFNPLDPDQLAVGWQGTVTLWNWRTDRPVRSFPGHGPQRITVAFSPDGRLLATGTWRGSVRLWNPQAGGEPLATFSESRNVHVVSALAFSPDNGQLAAATFVRRVNVWDTATAAIRHALPQNGLVVGVAFSPDGRLIASAGEDKVVHVWDAATRRELIGLRGHDGVCACVAFSPDGQRLASGGADGTLRVWDATPLRGDERQERDRFEKHGTEVWSLAVSPDRTQIISAAFGPPVMVWDAETKAVIARFDDCDTVAFCAAWHPDGRRVAFAGGQDGRFVVRVKVLDAEGKPDGFPPLESASEYFAVAFSPDGKHLVTGSGAGRVEVWDADTGRLVHTLGPFKGVIRGVAFSPDPDGKYLASMSSDGQVRLWDATRLGEKDPPRPLFHPFAAHSPGVGLSMAFSPDGERMVTGGKGHTVQIWDVETGKLLHTLREHTGDVSAVAFSPDGRWVASGGEDSTVKVWDGRTGTLLRSFRGHTGLVSTMAFLDERTLITGSRDHKVMFWDLTRLEEVPDR